MKIILSIILISHAVSITAADRHADAQSSDRYRAKLAWAAEKRLYRDGNVYTAEQTSVPLTEETALNPFWESLRTAPQAQKDANLRRALRLGFCTTCTPSTYLRGQRWHLAAAAIVGANLELLDLENCTPLYCAVTSRDAALTSILLSHGAIITPGMISCSASLGSGRSSAVLHELLIHGSAHPTRPLGPIIDQSMVLFHVVSRYDDLNAATAKLHPLLNAGASTIMRDRSGSNLLQSACANACSSAITFWRSYGFNPFEQDGTGNTCLHLIGRNRSQRDETIIAAWNALRSSLSQDEFERLAAMQNHAGRRAIDLAFPSVRETLNAQS